MTITTTTSIMIDVMRDLNITPRQTGWTLTERNQYICAVANRNFTVKEATEDWREIFTARDLAWT